MDGLAVFLLYMGIQHKNKANLLRTTETHDSFAEGQKALMESHDQYALFYFIGAGAAFLIAAFFILAWVKQRKKQMTQKDDWEDVS